MVELDLPDPLRRLDGARVTSAEEWQSARRSEILNLFQTHVYGRPTVGRPGEMTFNVVTRDSSAMGGLATLQVITIKIENPQRTDSLSVEVVSFVPNRSPKPVPGFVLINNRSRGHTDPTRTHQSDFWPAEAAIARGFGIAAFHVSDVDPDKNDFTDGVHKVFDGGIRVARDTWGALAAWAWGASRVLDYLLTDSDFDGGNIAIVGHSRGGKAALVAGACDERFALVISNNSGESGASLARRPVGERISDIVANFPHWFCENYFAYCDRENELPVDQHELLALIAPRMVYVASASEDEWADPEGEFLSLVHAAPVYALHGKTGLPTSTWPAPNTQILGDGMGYHLRQGSHALTRYDWDRFMDFYDAMLKR